jgi:hypothetical protein
VPLAELRLYNTPTPVATWVSEQRGERVDDDYEGYHVDWSQAAKLLLDAEQPSTIAECLATAARTLSGVLSCSAVETKGGAFMVRSGSHAVVRRHLSAGGRDTIERLLAQDFGALEP